LVSKNPDAGLCLESSGDFRVSGIPFFVFSGFTAESAESAEKNNEKSKTIEVSAKLSQARKTVIPGKRNSPFHAFYFELSKSLRSLRTLRLRFCCF
jgi:hypothetical protein